MTSRKGLAFLRLRLWVSGPPVWALDGGLAVSQHPVPHDANEVVGNEPEDGERLSTQAVLD